MQVKTEKSFFNDLIKIKPSTIPSLQRTIKMLNVMTVIFAVIDVLLIGTKGLYAGETIIGFALVVYFMSFKNQCETEVVKLKLENEIENLIIANKEM